MKKSLAIALMGASLLAVSVAPAQAVTPGATYNFNMDNNHTDQAGSATFTPAVICNSPATADYCNLAANFGSDSNGDFWHWRTTQENGGGAVLDTPAALGSTYSIYIKFAIDDESNDTDGNNCANDSENYTTVINTSNSTSDTGLYVAGCDHLYLSTGLETGETWVARGDVVEAVVTRNGATDEVTVFINYEDGFEESWVIYDDSFNFVIPDYLSGSRLRLFQDDGLDTSKEGAQEGRLYGIKVWRNIALTLEEVRPLATITPESNNGGNDEDLAPTGGNAAIGAWVLGLALVAGAGAFVLRRRNN